MGWLTGWAYQKSFPLSRPSGDVSNYQMRLRIGESAVATSQYNACESTTGWAVDGGSVVTATGYEGTNCIKFTSSAGAGDGFCYDSISEDWSGVHKITFWAKRGSTNADLFSFTIRSGSGDYTSVIVPLTTSWTKYEVRVGQPALSGTLNWSAISRIEFLIRNGNGAEFYLDDIRLEYVDDDCESHCESDFDDLRFTTSDGETLLDYWIEEISGITPNQIVTLWVEFDSIGTSETTFYMYYGNASASAVSNGSNTFIVFDDFERDGNGDPVGGAWTISAGDADISTEQEYGGTRSAKLIGGSTQPIITLPITADEDIAIQWRIYKEDASVFAVGHGDGSTRAFFYYDADEDVYYLTSSSTYSSDIDPNLAADTWHRLEMANFDWSANTYDIYRNESRIGVGCSESSDDGTFTNKIWLRGSNDAGEDIWIDNLIVRKWYSVQPTMGSWGSEEAESTTAAPTTLSSTTLAPTTLEPSTSAPTTLVPTTVLPTTLAPTTEEPTTTAPTTLEPTTVAPTTLAPTTTEPTTLAPTTEEPTTSAPTTLAPTTTVPTTLAPTTAEPTTLAPTTIAPTTLLPTTLAPTTLAPTTEAPTTLPATTLAPTTVYPSTAPPSTVPTTFLTTLAPTTSPVTEWICEKTCNSLITTEGVLNSPITLEGTLNGNICW